MATIYFTKFYYRPRDALCQIDRREAPYVTLRLSKIIPFKLIPSKFMPMHNTFKTFASCKKKNEHVKRNETLQYVDIIIVMVIIVIHIYLLFIFTNRNGEYLNKQG